MSKRTKFKITSRLISTDRGRNVYTQYQINIPKEIAEKFLTDLFTVKIMGDNIVLMNAKTKEKSPERL